MKVLRLVFGVFALAGLGMIGGGLYSIRHTRAFIARAESAPGVVIENVWRVDSSTSSNSSSSGYYPRIRFRAATGQEISFLSSFGSSPPSFQVGEEVSVLYDPQQPEHASVNTFWSLWFLSVLLFGLGAFFTAPGAGFLIWKRFHDNKVAWLQQNGRRIQATVISVAPNTSVEMNGTFPYRIACQWLDPATNQMHVFQSCNIWFDPSQYIPGKTIEVLIDPANPHRYEVQTGFLPQLA